MPPAVNPLAETMAASLVVVGVATRCGVYNVMRFSILCLMESGNYDYTHLPIVE